MELSTSFKEKIITYDIRGTGKDIILLHGFLEDKSMWEDLASMLSSSFRTIAIDLPGHGNTGSFGDYHSMDLMAECVHEVIKKEKVNSPVIIGHSMGGYVSLALTEILEDILGIVLYHSTIKGDSPEKKKDRDRAINIIDHFKENFIFQSIPNLFAEQNRSRLKNEIDDLIEKASMISGNNIKAALAGMRDRKNYFEKISQIKCPVYHIIGEKDPVLPLNSLGDQINHDLIQSVIMKETGHMSFIESSAEYKKIIRSIIDELIY